MPYTAIMLLVDRSGSMFRLQDSTNDAINEFVGKQAGVFGERRTIRIAQFDDVYEVVNESLSAQSVPKFDLDPRGMTALLDAINQGVNEFGNELAALPEAERPDNVVFAIMTDGLENASTEVSLADVKAKIEHQEQVYGWQFLYMGANQDAIKVGGSMGISANASVSYSASDYGTRSVIDTLNESVGYAASGFRVNTSDARRKDALRTK